MFFSSRLLRRVLEKYILVFSYYNMKMLILNKDRKNKISIYKKDIKNYIDNYNKRNMYYLSKIVVIT